MNPVLLFVSARRELLPAALERLRESHGRVLLVAPRHMDLPVETSRQVLRFPGRRFSPFAGLRILRALGARWPVVYCLAPSVKAAGMDNVTVAARIAGQRVFLIAPDGEVEVTDRAAVRREARRLLRDAVVAAILVPCWLASSLGLAATSRDKT